MTTELNQLNKHLVMDYWQALEHAETHQLENVFLTYLEKTQHSMALIPLTDCKA